jgi:hypothetical protein
MTYDEAEKLQPGDKVVLNCSPDNYLWEMLGGVLYKQQDKNGGFLIVNNIELFYGEDRNWYCVGVFLEIEALLADEHKLMEGSLIAAPSEIELYKEEPRIWSYKRDY